MARYDKVKESKNFKDRITSLVPQLFSPPGTFKPTQDQVLDGYYNMLNVEMVRRMNEIEAASKIQPGVERYENFDQPGYSPDIEVFWDEYRKKLFRDAMKKYHEQEENRKND